MWKSCFNSDCLKVQKDPIFVLLFNNALIFKIFPLKCRTACLQSTFE